MTPFRPIHDDKFVKPLVEQICFTFCLHVTDWPMIASIWSSEARYLKVWVKQFGSVHRFSSVFGKINPFSFQSLNFKTVLPSDSVNKHSTSKACNSVNGIKTPVIRCDQVNKDENLIKIRFYPKAGLGLIKNGPLTLFPCWKYSSQELA